MESKKNNKGGWETFVDILLGIVERVTTVCRTVWDWGFRLRKIFMAVPVLYAAWKLAERNLEELPEVVGFDLQSTGEFAQMISRDTAVYGPLGLTIIALFLMFCSRRTIFPWIISIFTLVLPILIWFLNTMTL